MQEAIRQKSTTELGGTGGLGSPFGDGGGAPSVAAPVTVASGPYAEQLPVANMSVGEVRARFRDRLDLDPHSVAILDGRRVPEDTVLRSGQVLSFIRPAGEKGVNA